MVTLRKRGDTWHVQVRRSAQSRTRSFTHKTDAEAWARKTERDIDADELRGTSERLSNITLGDLLKRYRDEVIPQKRSAGSIEHCIIAKIPTGGIRDPIKANATFERALNGRYFCPPGKHYPNGKSAKLSSITNGINSHAVPLQHWTDNGDTPANAVLSGSCCRTWSAHRATEFKSNISKTLKFTSSGFGSPKIYPQLGIHRIEKVVVVLRMLKLI